jgi:osmotically-inducible protein OsmY
MEADPRLARADIRVSVLKGVVTLTGVVPSARAWQHAAEIAHKADGVREVVNDLVVADEASGVNAHTPRRAARADAERARAVRETLKTAEDVPEDGIVITISHRRAALTGSVHGEQQRAAAERRVREGVDVVDVSNFLLPDGFGEAIADTDGLRVGRTVGRIRLSLAGMTLTIEGTVASWDERQALLEAAIATSAAYAVVDRLRVEGGV